MYLCPFPVHLNKFWKYVTMILQIKNQYTYLYKFWKYVTTIFKIEKLTNNSVYK